MMKFSFLTALIVLVIGANAQSLKKGFKLIEEKEFDRAKVIFDQALANPGQASIANYGLTLIFESNDYHAHDLYKAYDNIWQAIETFKSADPEELSKLADYIKGYEGLEAKKTQIDDKLFEIVKLDNQIKSSTEFLSKCSRSKHYAEVETILSIQKYDEAKKFNSIPAYEQYLKEFPNSVKRNEATEEIHVLAYQKAITENSLKSLEYFLTTYPTAKQAAEVRNKLISKEFDLALMTATDDAFEGFIKKYPGTDKANELKEKQLQINYIQAMQLNTLAVYSNFVDKHPNSVYTPQVRALRDSLAFAETKKVNTPEAFRAFLAKYPDAKQAEQIRSLISDLSFSKQELKLIKQAQKISSLRVSTIESYKTEGIDTTKLRRVETKHYSKMGYVEKIVDNSQSTEYQTIYTYDNSGRNILTEKMVEGGKLVSYQITYFYSQAELPDSAIITASNIYLNRFKPGTYKVIFAHDKNRNLVSKEIRAMEFDFNEKYTYVYNNENLLVEELITTNDAGNIKEEKYTYMYDFNENMIQKTHYQPLDKILGVESFTYDKNGNNTRMSAYDQFGKVKQNNNFNFDNQKTSTEYIFPSNEGENFKVFYKYLNF